MFTGAHETKRMTSALTPLEPYYKAGNDFLNHIVQVTGDEVWVSFVNAEPKSSQSSGCISIRRTGRKSSNKRLPARMLMATAFWGRKRVLMVEFMQQGTTIASQVYFETLKKSVAPFGVKCLEC
jgi:hypothetical protein